MKRVLLIMMAIVAISCGKASKDKAEAEANDVLYNEVMHIHDMVMPKMDDMYKLKRALQDSISHTPDMVAENRKVLENTIANLDSASGAMMNWMHEFDLPDSIDAETARNYLISELDRIKKVSDQMNESLKKAKEVAGK